MTFVLLLSGDINKIASYPHWSTPSFLIAFLSVVFSGCIFTYSMFLCTTINSALTTSCVSVLKSAVTTWIGMYTFGGVTPTTFFLLGQTINFTGGVMYTLVKYRNRKTKIQLPKQPNPWTPMKLRIYALPWFICVGLMQNVYSWLLRMAKRY